MRTQDFLFSDDDLNSKTPITDAAESALSSREALKHILIGSKKGVTGAIHTLHSLGYAEAGLWSTLLPTGNPGEVMSVLIRYTILQ